MILYEGPSLLDGAPIVAIARPGENSKTGKMMCTWILDQKTAPHEAVKTGADSSVCGKCQHRHHTGGRCYVRVHLEPRTIWEAYTRGSYPRPPAGELAVYEGTDPVRIGSYGDPAAVPFIVWESFLLRTSQWTGYTHQWEDCDPRLQQFCMASVDSWEERDRAWAAGWRTFRVAPHDGGSFQDQPYEELNCPASEESGRRTTCASCKLCKGNAIAAKSIFILAHGPWKDGS